MLIGNVSFKEKTTLIYLCFFLQLTVQINCFLTHRSLSMNENVRGFKSHPSLEKNGLTLFQTRSLCVGERAFVPVRVKIQSQ